MRNFLRYGLIGTSLVKQIIIFQRYFELFFNYSLVFAVFCMATAHFSFTITFTVFFSLKQRLINWFCWVQLSSETFLIAKSVRNNKYIMECFYLVIRRRYKAASIIQEIFVSGTMNIIYKFLLQFCESWLKSIMKLIQCYFYLWFCSRCVLALYRLTMLNISTYICARVTQERIHSGYFFESFHKVLSIGIF